VGVKGLCLAGPPRSGETSRLDLRDPVASGVKCGPHGGKKTRRSRRLEPVQGSDSRLESAHGVCGGSPENRRVHQDRRLGRRRRDLGAPRSFDAGGRVAGSQGLCREDAVRGNAVAVR
jgi:hypothetical protein